MINVSMMMCHFSGTTRQRWSHGKQRLQRLNRWVLRWLRKIASDGTDMMCCERPLQIRGMATRKARSPMVDTWQPRTADIQSVTMIRRNADVEFQYLLTLSSSARYDSATPANTCRQRQASCSQFTAPLPSTSAVNRGVEHCGRTLKKKTPA